MPAMRGRGRHEPVTAGLAMNRPRLCFVALNAYPVLAADRTVPFVGGAEVQQSFLAREFVRRGYAVSMICLNFGQPDPCLVDGITVHRIFAPEAGLPIVRFLHPRLTSLWAAMRRADADIYYHRTQGGHTGFVAAFGSLYRRISLYAAASDADFDPALPFIRYGRDRALFRWGLRHVSAIVVQSERQRQALIARYGRDATVVPSCYGHAGKPARPRGVILWAGTVCRRKRPELFLELARRCPQWQFRLVGGGEASEGDFAERISAAARALPNVEMTGFVHFADVETHFDAASLLVNTSPTEGFPNTFLQAWSRGMPTVSFFDPAAPWHGQTVGEVVDSIEAMAERVQMLMADEPRWARAGALSQDYFTAHHTVGRAVDVYDALFHRLGLTNHAGTQ